MILASIGLFSPRRLARIMLARMGAIQHWTELRGTPAGTPAALLKRFGQTQPRFDPYVIAKGIGVDVRMVKDRNWSGAVKFSGDEATIWLNETESASRRRFTLAHELGHLMLHARASEGMFRDVTFRGDPQEREANEFAGDLVMPGWAIRRYGGLLNFDRKSMAIKFGVSEDALTVRLAIMGERMALGSERI